MHDGGRKKKIHYFTLCKASRIGTFDKVLHDVISFHTHTQKKQNKKKKNKTNLCACAEHLCPEMHAMAKMAKLAKNRQPLAI